jgi:hypothetical protein
MPILDLLNPAEKAHFLSTTTDEDIFNAIMEARQAQRGPEQSDNVDEDTLDPIPTRAEALCAAKTLSHYTKDKDDPFLRQVDSTFGRRTSILEMNNMEDTKITSFCSVNTKFESVLE